MAICGGCLHHGGHSNNKAGNWRAPAAGHVCSSDAHSRQLALQRRRRGQERLQSLLSMPMPIPQHGLPQAADLAGECRPVHGINSHAGFYTIACKLMTVQKVIGSLRHLLSTNWWLQHDPEKLQDCKKNLPEKAGNGGVQEHCCPGA